MTRSSTLATNMEILPPIGARPLSDWEDVVREEGKTHTSLKGPIILGLFTLVIGFGSFFLWAETTSIASASLASGRVIVQSNTKTVSHLEGGTLLALKVEEGEKVHTGQILATLDVTRSQSTLTQLRQQLFATEVRLARLNAEKNSATTFSYTKPTPDGTDPAAAADVTTTEMRLFAERSKLYADQISADLSSIDQLASQRDALSVRRQAYVEQSAVLEHDYQTLATLAEKKLATLASANERKMQLVDMKSRIAESDAELAENLQRKAQLELSLANRKNDHFREISEQIQTTQLDAARFRQDIVSASDIVAKAAIRAPQDGVVANIRVRTPGSAVNGGQPVMDIVPDNQPMVIEGHARAADIDSIHIGERAEIRLSAFGFEEAKPLIGTVTYVAPDSTVDERTGDATFAFKATIDKGEMAKQPNLFLYPGMSADVYIVNGERTAFAYLAEPLKKSFARAFREK
jgi:HlyD family secretion protein